MIYLDYAANTPVDPAVLARFCEVERQYPGNANALHSMGRAARALLAESTDAIAKELGVRPAEIIYTSGASESNNQAVKGLAQLGRERGRHILSTKLEHASVSGCLTALRAEGFVVEYLNLLPDGKIDLADLRAKLRGDTILLAISAVDSELGVVQPVAEIVGLLRDFPNCRLHLDATQAVGKLPLCLDGVDTASMAAHKFYGLLGSGILYKRLGLRIPPLIHGGGSTTAYRSGTPTLALNISTELALRRATEERERRTARIRQWNDRLRAALAAYPQVRLNSPGDAAPHILNLSVSGVRATSFQWALDERGVCVSVKSACSTDGAPSQAVLAVTRDARIAQSSWRISLSHLTTEEELDRFLDVFALCYRKLRG